MSWIYLNLKLALGPALGPSSTDQFNIVIQYKKKLFKIKLKTDTMFRKLDLFDVLSDPRVFLLLNCEMKNYAINKGIGCKKTRPGTTCRFLVILFFKILLFWEKCTSFKPKPDEQSMFNCGETIKEATFYVYLM